MKLFFDLINNPAFLPFLEEDNGVPTGGGNDNNAEGKNSEDPDKSKDKKDAGDRSNWTREQWEAEIGRVASSERKGASEATERRIREEREAEEAEARGEFDKVKQTLQKDRDEFKGKVETLETENEVLLEFTNKILTEEAEKIPAAIRRFDPGKDAPIDARLKWLEEAREAATELSSDEDDGEENKKPPQGTKPNPKPNSTGKDDVISQVRSSLSRVRM